jgi:hypothetical protein
MSERIEVDVGLDGDEVEFGVSEDACDVGGLGDVWRCEPFPGDRSVGGAQVFGHHGGAGVVGKELCDVAVEGFARAVMDLFVGEVFAVVGVAQSCEGIEDELRLGQDGDRVGRGLRADGAARFGLPVEDEGVFGRCMLANCGAGGDGAEMPGAQDLDFASSGEQHEGGGDDEWRAVVEQGDGAIGEVLAVDRSQIGLIGEGFFELCLLDGGLIVDGRLEVAQGGVGLAEASADGHAVARERSADGGDGVEGFVRAAAAFGFISPRAPGSSCGF